MNEIRFSPIDRENRNESPRPSADSSFKPIKTSSRNWKKLLKIFLLILIIAGVALGGFYAWNKFKNSSIAFDPSASEYYGIFLTNGQVYFGKPVQKSGGEFVISDVYYLQASDNTGAQTQLNEPRFSLVKLAQEIHGPADKMFINYDQILFYEQLKKDSKVVESIKNYKN